MVNRMSATAICLLACAGAELRAVEPVVLERVAGLRARLEIVRDRDGVPHIRAGTEADAIFGLGFVHAQDRLWQLDHIRRLGRGRLAEVLGPSGLKADTLFRTLGLARSAAATWAGFSATHRELITSYVAGLNAATDQQRRNGLPPEFVILNFQPDRWTAEDVLVAAKVLAWAVDKNWDEELLRAQLAQKFGPERAAQLMPAYTPEGPIIVPNAGVPIAGRNRGRQVAPRLDTGVLSELAAFARDVAEGTGVGGPGIGSNNQAVSGSRSSSGKPMLASDPHLPSQIPSMFYRVHLTGGTLDVIGTTAVGVPGVLMGHNGRVAWGWTNANADVQDLFIEHITGNTSEYDGAQEPLIIRQEIIRVKGQSDVVLTVRATRHGPLVSDLINPGGPALALRWAALDADDDIGLAAYFDANKAANVQQFTKAFRPFKAHAQNMVYADTEGNIAYRLLGTIPVRAGGDGTVPVPGWTSAYEWKGYIPFDRLPASLNPDEGIISSANNKITPDSYPYTLSNSYAAPYRAARVRQMLTEASRIAPQDFERMQQDVVALHARELMSVLLSVSPADDIERKALDLLRRWDLRMTPESPAAAIFEAWYIQLAQSLFEDELGSSLWGAYSGEMHKVSMALSLALRSQPVWCDNVTTPPRESCVDAASSALTLALRRMAAAQGTDDLGQWQWSKVHNIVFFHQPFDADPALAARFNRTAPTGGDKHTVNQASHPEWTEFRQRHLPLYRQIIDLSDFTRSVWTAAPGQSGILGHPHYDDTIEQWKQGGYSPMRYTSQAIDQHAVSRLELRPQP